MYSEVAYLLLTGMHCHAVTGFAHLQTTHPGKAQALLNTLHSVCCMSERVSREQWLCDVRLVPFQVSMCAALLLLMRSTIVSGHGAARLGIRHSI